MYILYFPPKCFMLLFVFFFFLISVRWIVMINIQWGQKRTLLYLRHLILSKSSHSSVVFVVLLFFFSLGHLASNINLTEWSTCQVFCTAEWKSNSLYLFMIFLLQLHKTALFLLQTQDDLCFLTASQNSFYKFCLKSLFLDNNIFS